MEIDLSQFSQVFFEESLEGLDAMESELLNLDVNNPDDEAINTIFRAAHSIKGGSATFGFNQVAKYTHLLETLLDEIRDGRRQMTSEHQDMLLLSVDLLRNMFDALMRKIDFNDPLLEQLEKQFTLEIEKGNKPSRETEPVDDVVTEESSSLTRWTIDFQAGIDILRCGNDPALMFNELRQLGELTVNLAECNSPDFEDIDPEACYLSWQLELITEQPLKRLEEVFEWVEDECIISYSSTPAVNDSAEQDNDETSLIQTDEESIPQAQLGSEDAQNNSEDNQVDGAIATSQAPKPKAVSQAKTPETSSIRVSIDKIDLLINMVGELVITQAMLGQIGQQDEIDEESLISLKQGLEQLATHTRDLQESVMQIRMLPISFAFNRFPRLVRDIGQQLNKKVELVLKGEDTELDKTVMEKIVDPMVHLVRNSLDHGLETPEERLAKGKSEIGTITLNAFHQGGSIIIEIIDDGAGLNTDRILEKARDKGLVAEDEELSVEAIHQLIFKPGFSTADAVSDLSGRGVGMDVVRRNINELNGTIELKSTQDKGSRFTIRLPLTLAILDGQLVRVGSHTYVVPLVSIHESLQVEPNKINRLSDGHELISLRDEYLPVIKVYQEFCHKSDASEIKDGLVMVVDSNNEKIGLLVDELLSQQQVVIKSLEDNYNRVPGVSGATILGDGTVALIIDVTGLVSMAGITNMKEHAA
ncbi:chemotaxis protein CheA [Shewanella eurypsychrophilus]|uniref:Chemotaxis protein CheA n=1 Tax=Shewanella eurypsychrophilus TaxID=2593656 RepID=A0ABX6V0L6_9GAMM|nr:MULTISPECIES: chemotaxis protein CheA [Shewanella]QFU20590.1 chemotaxis protein CheA [Shewanella sp. YLB-09]QFU20871.1 chemotaxis protein CheA [Shewanella sp. YLB-09]QPG56160.1 chemotaxis protein CheA [Shewanella eurypsychrophilus]